MADSWTGERDRFEDGSTIEVGQLQLDKMKVFVEQHAEELRKIESALDDTMTVGWDLDTDPISLDLTPYEQTTMLELIKTKSKPVTKVTLVFASLCQEIEVLCDTAEQDFYPPLALFGELHTENPLEGDAQLQLGKMFPLFTNMVQFVERCYVVLKNLIRQLANLYHPQQKGFHHVIFSTAWKYMAQLLNVLITLDEIIANNDVIPNSWGKYKRMVTNMKKEPGTYKVEEEELFQFEKLMLRIKGVLMDGLIFQNAITQDFEEAASGRFQIRTNQILRNQMLSIITSYYTDLRGDLNTDPSQGKRYLRACTLFAFFQTLFPEKPEKKIMQGLWDIYPIVPLVHLYATATWDATTFFQRVIPTVVKTSGVRSMNNKKKDALQTLVKTFPSQVNELHMGISQWMILLESSIGSMRERSSLLTRGLSYAQTVSGLLKNYLFLHFDLGAQIHSSQFLLIFKCFELLKSIHMMYHRRTAVIAESVSYMVKAIAHKIQSMLSPIESQLRAMRNREASNENIDALAACLLAIQMLNGAPTRNRSIVFQLVYRQIPAKLLKGIEQPLISALAHWDMLSNMNRLLKEACDSSLLYWTKALLPNYFKYIFANPLQAPRLTYIFSCFRDVVPLFKKVVHVSSEDLLGALKKEIEDLTRREIVMPLAMEIHEDLALHIHHGTRNKEVERQMVKGPFQQRDPSAFLSLKTLQFYDLIIDIKHLVSHFLNRTFYNINTVALFDWQAFGEMRSLAYNKYGLSLHQVHLPSHTLEQGLDILEIMRMIESFVSNYRYNLNNQIFIERTSDSNYLSVIGVEHIANSIRTHGTGICSTAVSVTYQFLNEKIHLFSQFLFDELIKSRLYRDGITLQESHTDNANTNKISASEWRYPYDMARKFQQYVRQLGLTKDKRTFLHKFKDLITEIGNAMGYVRMIRSGAMLYTSNAIQFVPDLSGIEKFEDKVVSDGLSPETVAAAHNLDGVINNLYHNFSEGADYFKMLVNVFATEYRSVENVHLKNFYLIVPALTLCFIEGMGGDKERYMKKNHEEGIWTDDGFAIGIAYLLKLLDQNHDFDSLNWFQSATEFYNQELAAKQRDQNNVKISQLTKTKLQNELREFQLLSYSLTSARIFFND